MSEVISRDVIFQLLAEEKDQYSQYVRLCEKYKIQPSPQATAASQAKQEILKLLLAGTPISKSLKNEKTIG